MPKQHQYHALKRTIRSRFTSLRNKVPTKQLSVSLRKRPFASFFVVLGILLTLIIVGNVLRSLNKEALEQPEVVKGVETYSLGNTPTVNVQAKIEKTGIVKILAQTSGVVDKVNISEGQSVSRGTGIVTLASTYSGASAPGIQARIAQTQYQNVLDTYDTQKEILKTQRDLAVTSRDNAEQMRQIAERSLGDTQELLRYNETMLSLVNQSLGNSPSDPQNGQFANPLQLQRAQFLGTVAQVRSQLRSLEQQVDANKAPNQLASLQEDLTLKQLTLQEKALDLQKETARLQSALAGINASLMMPASPFNGVVQRVYVRPGQSVNPGTPIALVSQTEHSITALAAVPYGTAQNIAPNQKSIITIGKKKVSLVPSYVSTDATEGQLYSVKYEIPLEYEQMVTDGQIVSVSIPVGTDTTTNNAVPFVPLDSVYQTQSEAFVYVVEGGKARAKKVVLGEVFGRSVVVESGLRTGDIVILSRNVIENDKVKIN